MLFVVFFKSPIKGRSGNPKHTIFFGGEGGGGGGIMNNNLHLCARLFFPYHLSLLFVQVCMWLLWKRKCEHKSCQEDDAFLARVQDGVRESQVPAKCITNHPSFAAVCLNVDVLCVAYFQMRQSGEMERQQSENEWVYFHIIIVFSLKNTQNIWQILCLSKFHIRLEWSVIQKWQLCLSQQHMSLYTFPWFVF